MNAKLHKNINEKQCVKCNLQFENSRTLANHIIIFHSYKNQLRESNQEIVTNSQLLYTDINKNNENNIEYDKITTRKVCHKPRRIYRHKSKRVGLTKIRMEDCLRCDACSCIYIDEADFHNHMTNFHQKFNTATPRNKIPVGIITRQAVDNPDQLFNKQTITLHRTSISDSTLQTSDHIKEKIKNRLSEVLSRRLPPYSRNTREDQIEDDDMSFLLSNVEVNIKIEPTADQFL